MKTGIKKSVSLLMSLLLICTAFSVAGFSASQKDLKGKYGKLMPVGSDFKTVVTNYNISTDTAKFNVFFKSGGYKSNVTYNFAIYSDKAMKNALVSASGAFPQTDAKTTITWYASDYKSGVYYGKTYTKVKTSSGTFIDSSSIYTFTIKLNKVASYTPVITGGSATAAGNYITWNSVKYADSYKVFRKNVGDTSWKALATCTETSYIDATAAYGTEYIYTVRVYDNTYASKFNKNGISVTRLEAPVFSGSAVILPDNAVNVSWGEVKGADGYILYRKVSGESSYTRIARIKDGKTTYTDKSQKTDGTVYTYVVKAYAGASNGLLSRRTSLKMFTAKSFSSIDCKNAQVMLAWNEVTEASSYKIYKRAAGSGEWQLLTETDALTYTDEAVEVSKQYIYSLTAVKGLVESSFDSVGKTIACLGETEISSLSNAVDNSVLVKWKATAGATDYNVYRLAAGGEYELIGTSGGKAYFYDSTNKKNNLKYTYAVEAVAENSVGTKSTTEKYVLFMEAPQLKSLTTVNDVNKITWESVAGATSYNVYRKTKSGSWVLLANTSSSARSFSDGAAKKGTAYYYTVAALNGNIVGSFMGGLGANCLGEPQLKAAVKNKNGTVKVTWNAVNGASGYYVFRKLDGGSWTRIGKTSSLYFTDSAKLASGSKYVYTVRAYDSKGTGIYNNFGVSVNY